MYPSVCVEARERPEFGQNFIPPSMWWGQTRCSIPYADDETVETFNATTFSVEQELHDLDRRIELLSVMQEPVTKSHIPRQLSLKSPAVLAALPQMATTSDTAPLNIAPVSFTKPEKTYWSADADFWEKWKTDERKSRQDVLEAAKSALENAKKEASVAAAAAEEVERLRKEKELADREREEVLKSAKVKEPQPPQPQQPSVSSSVATEYDNIMASGKQFRPQFMEMWKEISLGVSATAGNGRSIQLNCTKVANALRKAATQCGTSRPQVITWLSAFCGSKIVGQACSGNKALVWSFGYFARTLGDSFPDVVRIGVMGEIMKIAPNGVIGLPSLEKLKHNEAGPKDFELHTRFLLALMITCQDEGALWAWLVNAIEGLRKTKSHQTNPALWRLMKVYVWMDLCLYDFRRIFGTQANMVLELVESEVFPKIDADLQRMTSTGSATNISVLVRFYLDSCYNILQSRKYTQPPEGRMLAAAKESELNPEL